MGGVGGPQAAPPNTDVTTPQSDAAEDRRRWASIYDLTANAVIKSMEFDEFGIKLSDSNPAFEVPFGFAGGLYDGDTKLTRFGARDYDASVGRWVSKDPILFGGRQANLYVYVGNNPINLVDLSGLYPTWAPHGGGIVAGGSAEVGAGFIGAGVQAAAGEGFFFGGPTGASFSAWESGGAFTGLPGTTACFPSGGGTSAALGAYAGLGGGFYLTNATTPGAITGSFHNISINTPWFGINIGFGGGTWVAAATFGPMSAGSNVSYYDTWTVLLP